MLIVENTHAQCTLPPELNISDADFNAVKAVGAGPYSVPFEILGEPIVPGFSQVPLVLQGTFLQLTNTGSSGSAVIQLIYRPTVPFVTAPQGGKVKLMANLVNYDLSIIDYSSRFQNNPASVIIYLSIPANQTLIFGVQYVATGLSALGQAVGLSEAAGNRGIIQLVPSTGSTFLATATVRQFFVSQQGSPLMPIAAAAYSVAIGGGPVITG